MSEDVTKIDINQADVAILAELSGVGEALAQRIVEYRETVRPFTDIDELTAVPGISAKMVAQFADQIVAIQPEPEEESDEFADFVPADEEVPDEESPDEADEFADFAPADEEPEIVFISADESVDEDEQSVTEADEVAEVEDIGEESPEQEIEPEIEEEPVIEEEPEPDPIIAIAPEEVEDVIDPAITKERMRQEAMSSEQTPPTQPLPPPTETGSQRKGIGFGLWLFGVILGALLGSVLTLFLLATLNNGNLQYSASDARLARDLQTSNDAQEQLGTLVDALSTRDSAASARIDELTSGQEADQQTFDELGALVTELDTGLDEAASLVATLEADTTSLEERVDTVAAASENFDTFLTSLRDLLIDVQGLPPTLEPTATMTPTLSATPPAGDDDLTPTSTVRPTRTPRPTTTPFATSATEATTTAVATEEAPTPTHTPVPQP